MKIKLLIISILTIFLFIGNQVFSQCTPGDATSCPDPENNGEVCPAVLPPIYVQVAYEQQFTVLAPPELDTLGTVIPLHHITLLDVQNLPEGIIWQSNAPNNDFFVGTYYCVLLSGTTNATPGKYPLKIVVEVFATVLGNVISLGETIDSTSLSVDVTWNPNSIFENGKQEVNIKTWPNPFQDELSIQINDFSKGEAKVELFSLLGKLVYELTVAPDAEGSFKLNTSLLHEKNYLLSVSFDGKRYSKIISGLK